MKKLRNLCAVVGAFMAIGFGSSALARDYKVGDKMLDYKKDTSFSQQVLLNNWQGCEVIVQYYVKGNSTKYKVVLPSTPLIIGDYQGNIEEKIERLPFAILDFDTQTLYLDNKDGNGSKGSDGIIDEVLKNPKNRKVFLDSPDC